MSDRSAATPGASGAVFPSLWDVFDRVDDRLHDGKRSMKELCSFLQERSEIELQYARSMQKLCEKYGTAPPEKGSTVGSATLSVRTHSGAIGRQHEQLAIQFNRDIITTITDFKNKQKKSRDALVQEQQKQLKNLDKLRGEHNKARERYYKLGKDTDSVSADLEKSRNDPGAQKKLADLEAKAKKLQADTEKADSEYQRTVVVLNECEEQYYQLLNTTLTQFEGLESERYDFMRGILEKYLLIQQGSVSNQEQTAMIVANQVSAINHPTDAAAFVAANQTGAPQYTTQYAAYGTDPGPTPSIGSSSGISTRLGIGSRRGGSSRNLHHQKEHHKDVPSPLAAAPQQPSQARALYDYTAQDESELSFSVGALITDIVQDGSGWWTGCVNGQQGIFPANYCDLGAAPADAAYTGGDEDTMGEGGEAVAAFQCRALYPYAGETEDELTIAEGDIITVEETNEGWYYGTNERGEKGLFPANFTEVV